jgi:hypothetical protein
VGEWCVKTIIWWEGGSREIWVFNQDKSVTWLRLCCSILLSHIPFSSLKSVNKVAQGREEEVGICVHSVQPRIVISGETSKRVRFKKWKRPPCFSWQDVSKASREAVERSRVVWYGSWFPRT